MEGSGSNAKKKDEKYVSPTPLAFLCKVLFSFYRKDGLAGDFKYTGKPQLLKIQNIRLFFSHFWGSI